MNHREKIDKALGRISYLQQDLQTIDTQIQALTTERQTIEEMLTIARKAAKLVQDELGAKLSTIVTKALATVFEEKLEFVVEFVERRGVSECDLYVRDEDGHTYDILDSRGGGLADVCSVSLQMAFILLSDVDRYLINDEIARHLSAEHQERFAVVLQHLATEFGFTIIAVTHAMAFPEVGDRVFHVHLKNKTSVVRMSDGNSNR